MGHEVVQCRINFVLNALKELDRIECSIELSLNINARKDSCLKSEKGAKLYVEGAKFNLQARTKVKLSSKCCFQARISGRAFI